MPRRNICVTSTWCYLLLSSFISHNKAQADSKTKGPDIEITWPKHRRRRYRSVFYDCQQGLWFVEVYDLALSLQEDFVFASLCRPLSFNFSPSPMLRLPFSRSSNFLLNDLHVLIQYRSRWTWWKQMSSYFGWLKVGSFQFLVTSHSLSPVIFHYMVIRYCACRQWIFLNQDVALRLNPPWSWFNKRSNHTCSVV